MQFEFVTADRIIFGPGTLRGAGPAIKNAGRHPLVVTGKNPQRAEPVLQLLRENNIEAATFSFSGEPTIQTVRDGVTCAKNQNCDWIIGIGGGSVLDAGKAIAAMMKNEGDVLDYVEIIGQGKALTKSSARYLAIPTTAGTGSEVTRNAVLASPEHRLKVSLRSPKMLPGLAVVDPELTYDLPPAITASTGLDALTQLIEPYVCLRANPMTDAICLEGIRRVAHSFRVAVEDGQNKEARSNMAVASLFGGMALANAGLGAVHGFAGPIGGMFSAPHGEICAALLADVMEINMRALRERDERSYAAHRYYRVAGILTGNKHSTANAGIEWIRQLVSDFKIPRLSAHGIKSEAHSRNRETRQKRQQHESESDRADGRRTHRNLKPRALILHTHTRFFFNSFSNFASGNVFITSALVSQPFRATSAPRRKKPACSNRCASQLITHFTPLLFAYCQWRQSISSRSGVAFSSIHVPVCRARVDHLADVHFLRIALKQ